MRKRWLWVVELFREYHLKDGVRVQCGGTGLCRSLRRTQLPECYVCPWLKPTLPCGAAVLACGNQSEQVRPQSAIELNFGQATKIESCINPLVQDSWLFFLIVI